MGFGANPNNDPTKLQSDIDQNERMIEQLEADRAKFDADLAAIDEPGWANLVEVRLPLEKTRLLLKFRGLDPADERSLLLLNGQLNEVDSLMRRQADIIALINQNEKATRTLRGGLKKLRGSLEKALGY